MMKKNILNRASNFALLLVLAYLLWVILYALTYSPTGRKHTVALSMVAVLSIGCFLVLRLRSEIKARLSLLLASTLLSLFLVNWIVYYYFSWYSPRVIEKRVIAARKLGIDFDPRRKRDVIISLRKAGIPAVPAFKSYYLYHTKSSLYIDGRPVIPCGGVANALTVTANECGNYLIYESDEHGFHNPKGLYVADPENVVMVGDSFTHGLSVRSDENMAALLRAKYNRVVNLGYEGNGPLTELASLVEYGIRLRPKKVIWCYYEENDLVDLSEERETLLVHYLEKDYSNNLVEHQPEIDRALNNLIEKGLAELEFDANMVVNTLLFRDLRVFILGLRKSRQVHFSSQLALFREVLQSAKERTESWGGHLYFVYLPQYQRYGRKPPFLEDCYNQGMNFYEEVKEIVEQLGIPFIDVRKVFDNHPDPLSLFPFRMYGHYNPEGYRLAAETILKGIEDSTSVP